MGDPKADRYLPWPATNSRSSRSRSKKAINCGWMVCRFEVVLFTEVVQVDQWPCPEVRPRTYDPNALCKVLYSALTAMEGEPTLGRCKR